MFIETPESAKKRKIKDIFDDKVKKQNEKYNYKVTGVFYSHAIVLFLKTLFF